jgi:[acyl-carrier-protein] S-malonyltransferase
VGALIAEGPKEALALTTNTQPVMLVAGVACWRAWRAEGGAAGGRGRAFAGRVFGAGRRRVLTLAQAVPLVRLRAAAMQEAVPVGTGAMAAILGLDAKVIAGCADVTRPWGKTGRSGGGRQLQRPGADRDRRQQGRRGQGLRSAQGPGAKRALPLPVSAPFHSSLMKPAAERC